MGPSASSGTPVGDSARHAFMIEKLIRDGRTDSGCGHLSRHVRNRKTKLQRGSLLRFTAAIAVDGLSSVRAKFRSALASLRARQMCIIGVKVAVANRPRSASLVHGGDRKSKRLNSSH